MKSHMPIRKFSCVAVALVSINFLPGTAHAASLFGRAQHATTANHATIRKDFQIPKGIEVPVAFWRDVYSKYHRNQVVLHDTQYLQVQYQVIDLSDIAPLGDPFAPFPPEIRAARSDRVDAAMDAVRTMLLHLATDPKPSQLSPAEKKIVALFASIPGGAEKFRAAAEKDRLRSQTGLADRFRAGMIASGRYMPRIEAVFREEGVPWELSRLAFVESMFDLRAYSKVGASGIWQFMPGTARLVGMTANNILDERNDPLAATRGAAKLLRKNFSDLGTWPLAVNAYNAGPGRLRQAVAQLGTTNIATIMMNFQHPGYGFASRNFFAEYLAALQTYENRDKIFGAVELDPAMQFETVVTTKPVDLPLLAQNAGLTTDDLWQLNPGFTPPIYSGRLSLPAGYTIKVPPQKSRAIMVAMDHMTAANSVAKQ